MVDFGDLAKKLISQEREEVDLYFGRFNDGTEKEPDIFINRVYAIVETGRDKTWKDIVVYLSKEDDEFAYDLYECYRFPYTKDLEMLTKLLTLAEEQSRCRCESD